MSFPIPDHLAQTGLTQTIAEKSDFEVGAIHELPLPHVVLRKSYSSSQLSEIQT